MQIQSMQSRQRRHVWHLLLVYFPTFVLCPRGASGTAEYGAFPVLEACVIGSLRGCRSIFPSWEIHTEKSTWNLMNSYRDLCN